MNPRMDAYYYHFKKTNIIEIDLILSAVACAGKAFHHTDQWQDKAMPYPGHDGETPQEWIQNAADKAARAVEKYNKALNHERAKPDSDSESPK